MSPLLRRWLAVLLCLATLFNGVAIAASTPPVVQAAAPCEMGADHESGDDSKATCLQQCALLCTGALVTDAAFTLALNVPSHRVVAGAAALFDSHAGPPGFQPPR